MIPNKVCPVVFRPAGEALKVLAFRHPLAGFQLVKGTIEPGESVQAAALRELAEESGIAAAETVRSLGTWQSGFQGQVWEFIECASLLSLPDSWTHEAADDGGHLFEFFWHPLAEAAESSQWHLVFIGALEVIRNAANCSMGRVTLSASSNFANLDLENPLPRHKSDLFAAEAAVRLGWPSVKPMAMQLLMWLQDINWPVAQVLAPFFERIGADLAPHVGQILQTQDDVWKYYVISAVVARSKPLAEALEGELRRIVQCPTDSEHTEEVDRVAAEALAQL
ncbi:DUF5071 domain-containing protein [Ideonella azotifigens]|uniref:Nudix hydrolase domain-containing protein n=1 Tax=Ideonella azotifigens TaxID=513160 RepID=A0ABN1KGW6_9BURK|nr:DUF5071 domain-containing protein [Ideonella azotifigens]MCD2340306.1 DUF5071 domain-containing protein [Ideonella azotifigens]